MNPKLKIDWITIIIYGLILCFGWVNIYAAGYEEANAAMFNLGTHHGKQLIWIGIAIMLAVVIMLIDPRVFSNTSYLIYFAILLLLIVTPFIASDTKGGRSWIDFGAFKFQPSEFAKVATALALSKFMSSIDLDFNKMRTKIIAFSIIGVPAVLTLLQHDTGSALVFASFILPLFREGLSGNILLVGLAAIILFVLALLINKYILIGCVAAVCLLYLFVWLNKPSRKNYQNVILTFLCCSLFIVSVDVLFNNVLEPHQRERIDVLLGKSNDLKGSGYNVYQSKIAIGSGGFTGKGFLNGTITKADFVPEQETDFIFCTVGEEWGFWGSTLLIAVYVLLLVRLINMAERQRSTFARFYGYSVASILFIHILVNVGMVLGLLPVIGIPLPFFSYGGSSLLAFTILFFVFIRQDADKNQVL